MEPKKVPQDLIPVSDTCIDQEWAMKTIQYRTVFSPTEHVTIATQTHLNEWQEEAKNNL